MIKGEGVNPSPFIMFLSKDVSYLIGSKFLKWPID